MKQKTVTVKDAEDKDVEFVIRELTYGEVNYCCNQATKTNFASRPPVAEVNPFFLNEMRLEKAIVSPAEYKSLIKVKSLPGSSAEKLLSTLDGLTDVPPTNSPSFGELPKEDTSVLESDKGS